MTTITGTVTKETVETKVGLAFFKAEEEAAPLIVSIVRDGGLFANSGLTVGMLATSVNGTAVTPDMTAKQAADLLRMAEGECTVTAKAVIATVTKESPSTKCGISLQRQPEVGGVVITKLDPQGLFATSTTNLKEGMIVTAVQGAKCPKTTAETIALLRAAEGELTLVAIDPVWMSSMEETPEETPEPEGEEMEAPKELMAADKELAEDGEEKKEDDAGFMDRLCTICT